jgi:hypothetical protein
LNKEDNMILKELNLDEDEEYKRFLKEREK